mmetsp:Transcript_6017/g.17718  ORF Transcript_6017/g.17718 Transcript_6017/m.17718 type:complete len:392 (-) Transcript_6017:305-1480(-)
MTFFFFFGLPSSLGLLSALVLTPISSDSNCLISFWRASSARAWRVMRGGSGSISRIAFTAEYIPKAAPPKDSKMAPKSAPTPKPVSPTELIAMAAMMPIMPMMAVKPARRAAGRRRRICSCTARTMRAAETALPISARKTKPRTATIIWHSMGASSAVMSLSAHIWSQVICWGTMIDCVTSSGSGLATPRSNDQSEAVARIASLSATWPIVEFPVHQGSISASVEHSAAVTRKPAAIRALILGTPVTGAMGPRSRRGPRASLSRGRDARPAGRCGPSGQRPGAAPCRLTGLGCSRRLAAPLVSRKVVRLPAFGSVTSRCSRAISAAVLGCMSSSGLMAPKADPVAAKAPWGFSRQPRPKTSLPRLLVWPQTSLEKFCGQTSQCLTTSSRRA